MVPNKDFRIAERAALDWLLPMRWVAVAGQVIAIAVALYFYRAPLDLVGLGAAILVAASANLLVLAHRPFFERHAYGTLACLLGLDTVLLTAMLLLSGGLHNPFTSFFLLHITLATVLMRRREATILTVLAFISVFAIYRFPSADPHAHHWITMEMHFTGMMFTLLATGSCILLFVGRLQNELRQQEKLIQEHELKLNRQQRVVGLATLAAGVAHELATPLSTIAVASHELRLTASEFCQNKSCMSDSLLIRQEVDRCRSIIDRLSATGGDSRRRVVELSEGYLTRAIQAHLPNACMERLRVACPEPVTIEADEVALLQSLGALVKNGCEADESGGPVTLTVGREGAGISLAVRDNGPGIPEDVVRRLGEPFVTTKDPGKGIGLGLYLVHMFCYLHEGKVSIVSGHQAPGTTVEMILPAKETS